MLLDAVTSSMSPLPISRSAPGWSKMTRLSASDETENAIRLGTLALITPGDDVDARTLGCEHQVDADARAIWAMRTTDSSTSRAATIIKSFSSSTTMTMYGRSSGPGCRLEVTREAGRALERFGD